MAGDAFKKVRAGQPLAIPATTFNSFLDAAESHKRGQRMGGPLAEEFRQATIIRVRNETEVDQPRFACLGIDAPIILPADNEHEFASRVALRCSLPDATDHEHGRFVILIEPLKDNEIGLAFAAGVCPVKLFVEDTTAESYRFANHKDGENRLAAAPSGPATILWMETVTGGPGVEAWAVIRIVGEANRLRRFEMKDTVEEKAWDFDVKGDAYYLKWDEGSSDWVHEDGDPTAEVWGDRFLHGVAFGDDGIVGAGDRVTCWYDDASARWWIIEGGQTFIVADITQQNGISKGSDGTATLDSGDARQIPIRVKASIMALTDNPAICYCWWDDAGGGHWDGMQPGAEPGCGLKKDAQGKLAIDPPAVAGFGLMPGAGCTLDVNLAVIAGCGLIMPLPPAPPILNVHNIDLAGQGLVPGENPCDLDVNVGCGLWINNDFVEVANDELAGMGLMIGQNDCDLDVDIACGLEFEGNSIKVRPQDLAGAGLEGDLFQPGECKMQIDFPPNCGLAFDANDKLVVDLTTMAGPGLVIWTNPWGCIGLRVDCDWIEQNCSVGAVVAGCGLFENPQGELEVANDELTGQGLVIGQNCELDVALGCGLQFDQNAQVEVNPVNLSSTDIQPSGVGCGLQTVGFTGPKQVMVGLDCGPPGAPHECPEPIFETWHFENGLLKWVQAAQI